MNSKMISVLLGYVLLCGQVQAQFSVSNVAPIFISPPSSTMGTVTGNTLTLTPLTNGFVVSGQVTISIPPGANSGILAQWTVERRLDPGYAAAGIQTNTILTGFSAPPSGTFGTTTGSVITDYRFSSGSPSFVGGSQSLVPMTLVNGIDSPAWAGLTATSVPFTWNGNFFPAGVMQQQFTLFGNYTSGLGGNWVIDVPVTSLTVPEPAGVAGLCVVTLFVGAALRAKRKHVTKSFD